MRVQRDNNLVGLGDDPSLGVRLVLSPCNNRFSSRAYDLSSHRFSTLTTVSGMGLKLGNGPSVQSEEAVTSVTFVPLLYQ